MKRLQLPALLLAIVASGTLLWQATTQRPPGAVDQPMAPPAAPAQPSSGSLQGADAQAEERLLNEQAFSHKVSAPVPDVGVLAAGDRKARLDVSKGVVTFVNFWASWCPPCVEEMPSMLKLGSELAAAYPKRFRMVAVSGDDTWQAIDDYFKKSFGGRPKWLEVVRDPDAAAARAYYCAGRGYCPDVKYPETYLVDRTGRMAEMIVGARDWSSSDARQLLEGLLKAKP
jgi:thiol-disulfide isomerase/thioredoxin